ncbi:T9SS type A sorting domain-containing protein [bacterium]|nr:T9SS type A sorting domain-containing protein [bacterium]
MFLLVLTSGFLPAQTADVQVTLSADNQPVHNALGTLQNSWTGETLNAITDSNGVAFFQNMALSVDDTPDVPRSFQLYQNYPNPFNPGTCIPFSLDKPLPVKISIYSITGSHVVTLTDRLYSAANHTIYWNGTGKTGRAVASGVYIIQLQTPAGTRSRKCLCMEGGGNHSTYVSAGKPLKQPLAKSLHSFPNECQLTFENTDSTSPKIETVSRTIHLLNDTAFTVLASLFDDVSPAVVNDLNVSTSNVGAIALQWTAPGDDGNVGKASAYVVRINSVPIDSSNWNSSVDVNGEPVPFNAGSVQTMNIYSDISDTIYAAIKALDEKGNVSSVSNSSGAETGFYLLSGFLKQVPNMFGVDSAVVSFGTATAFSDSGYFELKVRSPGEKTFSVKKAGYYNYDKDMGVNGNTNIDVTQMIEQYTDPVTGEDLLSFFKFLTKLDTAPVFDIRRWNNLPVSCWLNRTYLDTTGAYDIFEGRGAAYADSVWKGFDSWNKAVQKAAEEMNIEPFEVFTEVDLNPETGGRMKYNYGPGAAYSSMIYENFLPKKGIVRLRGLPDYEPLEIENVTRMVSHETGHQLMFIEHSTYPNHIMNPSTFGGHGKPSDFEARIFIVLYNLENLTPMRSYSVPSKSTSTTNIPVFDTGKK